MNVGNWLYALACVVLPVAWGLLMVVVVGWIGRAIERARPQSPNKHTTSVEAPDYYI